MPLHLARISQLDVEHVDSILARAATMAGSDHRSADLEGLTVGLLFLSPSLRTRTGFAVAAHRLGARTVVTEEARGGATMSAAESIADTVRTMAGMVDALVVRAPVDLTEVQDGLPCPSVSGGDNVEHPTQALVDLAAIEEEVGPVAEQCVTVVGDLRQRCVRSLVELLARKPPRSLVLAGPATRALGTIPSALPDVRVVDHWPEGEADVLYLAGLPARGEGPELGTEARYAFRLTPKRLEALGPSVTVLSPMPVIDEITDDLRDHPQVRYQAQSDRSQHVRAAVLEHLLGVVTAQRR